MSSVLDAQKVLAFLNEFRVLECGCCAQVFGFQSKFTGMLFCTGGCHECSPPSPTSLKMPLLAPMPSAQVMISTPLANTDCTDGPMPPLAKLRLEPEPLPVIQVEKPKLVVLPPVSRPETVKQAPATKPETVKQAPATKPETVKQAPATKPESVKQAPPATRPEMVKQVPAFTPTQISVVTAPVKKPEVAKLATVTAEKPKVANTVDKAQVTNQRVWSSMKYSDNLVKPDAQVRIQFASTPVNFVVVSDADETQLQELQTQVKKYATSAERMKQAPVVDEIVIGDYEGEFYRARVAKVVGEKVELAFIDFGDKTVCMFSEIIPISDALMKLPVYGMNVQLKMPPLPVDPAKVEINSAMEDMIYNDVYIMDMNKKGAAPAPGQAAAYEVRLWDLEKDNTLNEKLTTAVAVAKTGRNWHPQTRDEKKELAYYMSTSSHFRMTRQMVEETFQAEALKSNKLNEYVFRLDNADVEFPYKIQDLPLMKSSDVIGEVEVEVAVFKSLERITAIPIGEPFDKIRDALSEEIGSWMIFRNDLELERLKEDFIPNYDEMCIVQWPAWSSVCYSMQAKCGKEKWAHKYTEEVQPLDIFKDDYDRNAGKWFRAACASWEDPLSKDHEDDEERERVYEMFLVDLGKTTLIPSKYVYRMPHRFMIDMQMSVFISLQLNDIEQYSDNVNDKWKYLLLPGQRLKVKFLWMVDHINIVELVSPSEKQFEKHFRRSSVQKGIEEQNACLQSQQRHRKVKKIAKMKGTYQTYMDKALAQEAEEEKLKPFKQKYSGIGRVDTDCIFELRLPDA